MTYNIGFFALGEMNYIVQIIYAAALTLGAWAASEEFLTPGVGKLLVLRPNSSLTVPIVATVNPSGAGANSTDLSQAPISGYAVSVVWCNGPLGFSYVTVELGQVPSPLHLESNIQLCSAVGEGVVVDRQCIQKRHYGPADGSVASVIMTTPVEGDSGSVPLYEIDPLFEHQNVTLSVADPKLGAALYVYVAETRELDVAASAKYTRSVPGSELGGANPMAADMMLVSGDIHINVITTLPKQCSNTPGLCLLAFYAANTSASDSSSMAISKPGPNYCGAKSAHNDLKLIYSSVLLNETNFIVPGQQFDGVMDCYAFLVLNDTKNVSVANSVPLAIKTFDFRATTTTMAAATQQGETAAGGFSAQETGPADDVAAQAKEVDESSGLGLVPSRPTMISLVAAVMLICTWHIETV